MSGLFNKPDTSAAEEQIRLQREQIAAERERAMADRRAQLEELAARRKARMRGGPRMLLSGERLAPETGLSPNK
jgi:hypothetical protein